VTYEEFLKQNSRSLLRFAVALTGDVGLAEDLAQDTLIKTYQAWPRIAGLDNPWAYVRRILVNEHVSWRRKWSRIKPTAAVEVVDQSVRDFAEDVVDRDEVTVSLAVLPPRQRAAIVLRYLEGLSVPEIARTLGCREATARGYISKGLSAMRKTARPSLRERTER
jgi:RNA polymerase sigma-70 factor (sigma-E family)